MWHASMNINNLEVLEKSLQWWEERDYRFVRESWITESKQFILSKLWHGLVLDAAVLHTLQISKGAAGKAVKFAEDFLWDYSRLLGTKMEIWGYGNTVTATELTQGDKTPPTHPSLPSWGNASFWGWGMSVWFIYMLQWSWSPSHLSGTLEFPDCFKKKLMALLGKLSVLLWTVPGLKWSWGNSMLAHS